MKKDIYPDVRIEIISEGLTKKILESSESPAPAVYGEEQPEGKNLPNVSIKGKNKELQSVLETSNKKPTYTGLVKEAIQELRKDNQNKYAVGSDKRELTAPGAMTGPNFGASREREDTPVIRGGTGLGGRETDAPLTEDRVDIDLRRQGTPIPEQASTSERGLSPDFVDRGDQALSRAGFSTGTTRESTTVQGGKIGDVQPTLTEAGFGRGASEAAKKDIPAMAIADKSKKESARMRGAASIGSGRLEEAMVKEAVQELRKSKKKVSELSKDNGPMVGALPPLTTTDVISNVNQAVNSGRSLDAGTVKEITDNPQKYQTQLTSLFDKGTQEQKLQVGFGALGSGLPKAAAAAYKPPETAGLPTLDQTLAGMTNVPTVSEAGEAPKNLDDEPLPTPNIAAIDAARIGQSGKGGEDKGPSGPMGDSGLNYYKPMEGTSDTVVIDPTKDGATAPDRSVDSTVLAELNKKNKGGFSSTSLSPEILRPKGTGDKDLPEFQSSGYFSAVLALGNLNDPSATDKQKEDAMKDYGLTGLSSDGSSISPLSEFLSLYAQNESQFDQTKFLDNIGEVNKADLEKADIKNPFRAALKKQAPPMAMTMNRPPNMGVGVQQPVVTGAGTMKNTEKAVAANKPAATPARTKARRTAAGSIEQRKEKAYIARQAQKALIKSGMVWDQINKQWVPMSKG